MIATGVQVAGRKLGAGDGEGQALETISFVPTILAKVGGREGEIVHGVAHGVDPRQVDGVEPLAPVPVPVPADIRRDDLLFAIKLTACV